MKVIFIQDVAKVGVRGEIKNFADSYVLNVLLPKKQVIIATPEAIKKIEQDKKNKEVKKEIDKNLFMKAMNELQSYLTENSNNLLEIKGHKADNKGHLFSQIKENDIVDAIFKIIKISLNPDQVILPKEQIKNLGEYEIELKDKDFKKKIKIMVK